MDNTQLTIDEACAAFMLSGFSFESESWDPGEYNFVLRLRELHLGVSASLPSMGAQVYDFYTKMKQHHYAERHLQKHPEQYL